MSLQDLFGSGSENSDNENQSTLNEVEQLPSTQQHMDELFGGLDDDDDEDQDNDARSATSIEPVNEENEIMEEEEDQDEDARNMPTTQDLFGDEDLDVSSDEKEEQENSQDDSQSAKNRPSTPEDRPPTPEEEGLSIAIELPRCSMSLGKELTFIKLPNFLSVDTKPFDPNFYEDEIDDDEVLDEEGRARLKLRVENTIRWRYAKDKDGNEVKESNCRMVRWSDGSLSMHLGNEIFDVFKMPVTGEQNHLFVQQGTGLQAQAVFKKKLIFRPHSTASQTHKKMTMSIADRMSKAQKIKMMPATELDPESQRKTMLKKEDERLRSATRRESAQRRIRERSHSKGLTSNYLEQDMEGEEEFEESIASIKNKYKKTLADRKLVNDVYSEDSEDEEKLRKAKLDIDSDNDDDDAELKQKKEELAKKKKFSRKIIDESEDSD
ncbi:RNA polymerase-associated protein LEO1 [Hydra vulgaris]|uniref:RNA polymerase-associated protein LEO1 n=1 Tax=Hydra vulgaris TaxID=6087 RepID=T2M8Z4_HYDVU